MKIFKIALAIHTERLHDDNIWFHVKNFADRLHQRRLRATWFAVNPTFIGYQKLGFNENKWIERLRYLIDHGQIIEQHTHFYERGKGDYNLAPEHLLKRLVEDRNWLEKQGYHIRGFVSGAWRINQDILNVLKNLRYEYDCSDRTSKRPRFFGGLVEMPTTASVRRILFGLRTSSIVYCHDYDFKNLSLRIALRILAFFGKIIAVGDLVKEFKNRDIILHPHDHKREFDWRVILNFLDKHWDGSRINSVLELGAGTGNIAVFFAKKGVDKIVAEDIDSDHLATIQARDGTISVIKHDINTPLPFANNSFDLVTCLGTLHYSSVNDFRKVLEEMKRVSGHYVLFDLFSRHSLYYYIVERLLYPPPAPRRFSPSETINLIKEIGLTAIDITSTRNLPILSEFYPYLGKMVIFLCDSGK